MHRRRDLPCERHNKIVSCVKLIEGHLNVLQTLESRVNELLEDIEVYEGVLNNIRQEID